MNKEWQDEVIEGQYWYVEPIYSSNETIKKKEKSRLNYHKRFGWTLDCLKRA